MNFILATMDNNFDSTEQDGYAMVSQLNELRNEFLKAKKYFEIELENMEVFHEFLDFG